MMTISSAARASQKNAGLRPRALRGRARAGLRLIGPQEVGRVRVGMTGLPTGRGEIQRVSRAETLPGVPAGRNHAKNVVSAGALNGRIHLRALTVAESLVLQHATVQIAIRNSLIARGLAVETMPEVVLVGGSQIGQQVEVRAVAPVENPLVAIIHVRRLTGRGAVSPAPTNPKRSTTVWTTSTSQYCRAPSGKI